MVLQLFLTHLFGGETQCNHSVPARTLSSFKIHRRVLFPKTSVVKSFLLFCFFHTAGCSSGLAKIRRPRWEEQQLIPCCNWAFPLTIGHRSPLTKPCPGTYGDLYARTKDRGYIFFSPTGHKNGAREVNPDFHHVTAKPRS